MLEKYSSLHTLCIEACQNNGFEPNVVFTDSKPENLIELVIKGMGVALLMKQLALYLENPEISIIDIEPKILAPVCLGYRADSELSDAAKQFVYCTKEQRNFNKLSGVNQ